MPLRTQSHLSQKLISFFLTNPLTVVLYLMAVAGGFDSYNLFLIKIAFNLIIQAGGLKSKSGYLNIIVKNPTRTATNYPSIFAINKRLTTSSLS